MPYGSFHVSLRRILRNAVRLVKEGGAEAVKVEGGERRIELIARLIEAEIPVMGHVGLTPQSRECHWGFSRAGQTPDAAADSCCVMRAPSKQPALSQLCWNPCPASWPRDHREVRIPTIGIGAGPDCDGQVLVFHDLVGLTAGHAPKFARQYANLSVEVTRAVSEFCGDVRSGRFPSDAESFHSAAELREHLPVRERA